MVCPVIADICSLSKMPKPGVRVMTTAKKSSLQWKILARRFYARDPRLVAPELLGKVLLRRSAGTMLAGRIVELEAYLGDADAAAHAASGMTPRNSVLFGEPGHAYVYFIYGMHYCLNISCMPKGDAGCVLIRALEPLAGMEIMAELRGVQGDLTSLRGRRMLTSGPGRLCQALEVTRLLDNGKDVTSRISDLQIVDDGAPRGRVLRTPRVGIRKATEAQLRYILAGNPFVSGKPKAD